MKNRLGNKTDEPKEQKMRHNHDPTGAHATILDNADAISHIVSAYAIAIAKI
jgi:hypothetical protein